MFVFDQFADVKGGQTVFDKQQCVGEKFLKKVLFLPKDGFPVRRSGFGRSMLAEKIVKQVIESFHPSH